ncbi:ABC transporter permease [Streptococcus fryi]
MSLDVVTILSLLVSSMLIYATPLIFTSIGGTFSERSGMVNIGLEGIMVMGAFSGIVFNLEFAETLGKATPWIAVLVGGVVGLLFSLIHAVATVNFRADHVVSGTVLNLLAPALSIFLVKAFYGKGQTDNIQQSFGKFDFPILSDIPVIGDIFFKNTALVGYIAVLFSFVAWYILYKTRFGLRLRSVGEHPQAADTLGINVYQMRYFGIMISGFLGGIGGAIYAQLISVNFAATTILGPGFIALAAMIFGKWNPIGAMLASLFFGISQSLAVIGSQLPLLSKIPTVYLQMAPYALTVVVLAVFFGQAVGPKANGQNYIKSK